MKRELEFLQISSAKQKGDFLQHIDKLYNIPLEDKDTYEDLFSKITERMTNENEEEKMAAKNWIKLQYDGIDKKLLQETILTKNLYNKKLRKDGIAICAVFSSYEVR